MATELIASRRLGNVEVLLGDARQTGLDASSFDEVHARTLLINVPDPGEVVAEMVRLAKPGGWVLSFEPDCEPSVCYPPNTSYDRLTEIFPAVFTRNGADWRIGRRVAELYRAAGLVDVQVEARSDIYPTGHTRRTILVDLVRSMRPYVVELKLATDQELEQLFTDALTHLENPETIVMPNLFFLVSGRKAQKGCLTKSADSAAGRPSGLLVELSYGRAGSLSRGVSYRQLVMQTVMGS
jgi:SAM-dependent methyltransferase